MHKGIAAFLAIIIVGSPALAQFSGHRMYCSTAKKYHSSYTKLADCDRAARAHRAQTGHSVGCYSF